MDAMARPGEIKALGLSLAPPYPLSAAAAAVALTLMDYETAVWLDPPLASSADAVAWLKFHTGARITAEKAKAAFALIADPAQMPALDEFAPGTLDYPDRSTTLIVQIERFDDGEPLVLKGPGIPSTRKFTAAPLPRTIAEQLAANHRLFPRGVDLIFAAANSIAALPRSVQVLKEG
jgi:alpha-D-ribose 1-methylphosphonate 5-triphosphate synthase subunit PhnH